MQDTDSKFDTKPEAEMLLFSRGWRALQEDSEGIEWAHPIKPDRARVYQDGNSFRIRIRSVVGT